eukprot:3679857-Rhodomonas_salina.2
MATLATAGPCQRALSPRADGRARRGKVPRGRRGCGAANPRSGAAPPAANVSTDSTTCSSVSKTATAVSCRAIIASTSPLSKGQAGLVPFKHEC